MMFNLGIAYLLWCIGGFGAFGLHRFYLGKIGTGVLWALTGGVAMFGAVIDFFRMPQLVRDANLLWHYRDALDGRASELHIEVSGAKPVQHESIEKVILRIAKANGGLVSAGEVASEGDWTLDQARAYLEALVDKGHAEMRATKSGSPPVAFVVPEFLTEHTRSQLEDLT